MGDNWPQILPYTSVSIRQCHYIESQLSRKLEASRLECCAGGDPMAFGSEFEYKIIFNFWSMN
jgi:hypothetical protein